LLDNILKLLWIYIIDSFGMLDQLLVLSKNFLLFFCIVVCRFLRNDNSLIGLSTLWFFCWSTHLRSCFQSGSVVQVRHIYSLGVVLVLLEVSLGTHVLLLFKIFNRSLGVDTVVEKLNVTIGGILCILNSFFGLLIAVVSCVCTTVVSHDTRFLRNITFVMLLILLFSI